MNKKYMKQSEFFTKICYSIDNNDLDGVKDLYYNHYVKQKNTKFNSFLKIFGLKKEVLELYPSIYPLEHACYMGRTEILDFLLQDKDLVTVLDKNRQLTELLIKAFSHGNIETANIIIPHLKVERKPEEKEYYDMQFFNGLLYGLLGACERNHLHVVKHILNDKDLNFNTNSSLYSEMELEERGSIPNRCMAALAYNNSMESLHYVIYELNDKKSYPFRIESCKYEDLPAMKKLTEYKELQFELKKEPMSHKATKKLKV